MNNGKKTHDNNAGKGFGLFLALFFILISATIVKSTDTEYQYIGYNDFNMGSTLITDSNDDISYFTQAVNNPEFVPLIDNLDGTGDKEIVLMVNDNLVVYNGQTLTVKDSFQPATVSRTYQPYIYDIDGDSTKEILLPYYNSSSGGVLHVAILNFDGVNLNNENNVRTAVLSGAVQEYAYIGCVETHKCLLMNNNKIGLFNESKSINEYQESPYYASLPSASNFEFADYDADGVTEIIYSGGLISAGDEIVTINYFYINSSNHVVKERQITNTYMEDITDVGTADISKYFSAPMVYDFDLTSAGLETLIAVQKDTTEFRAFLYDKNGNEIDVYPQVLGVTFNADGKILSNWARGNFLSGSTNDADACIMSDDQLNDKVTFLCISEQNGFDDNEEIDIDKEGRFNLTTSKTFPSQLIHAVQTDGQNEDEILTSWGIFQIDGSSLEIVYNNPKGEGVAVPVDYEGNDLNDIIMYTSTNLWYIDDGFSNKDCLEQNCISSVTINPDNTQVWKQNTSVQITTTIEDLESDDLNLNVTLYYDDTNTQTETAYNVTSGTSVPLMFIANKTGNVYKILIESWETQTPSSKDTQELTFSVSAVSGISFGDGTSEYDFEDIEEVEDVETVDTDPDNAIVGGVNALAEGTGLSSGIIVILIACAIVYFTITNIPNNASSNDITKIVSLGFLAFYGLLFVATKIKLVPSEWFTTFVIIGIVVVVGGVMSKIFIKGV